jgi:histidyl-tRNA synthetase
MRILDCKSPVCKGIAENSPVILDYLCDECREHFETLQKVLKATGIDFTVNPRIVRGLDYYTKTVFEFVAKGVGTQGTVCGGGRYDTLIEEIGGKPQPALGFAMGIERLMLALDEQGIELPKPPATEFYIGATDGEAERFKAAEIVRSLRKAGHTAESDIVGRSVKAQMKYADKIGAVYSCIIGESELQTGKVRLKRMENGDTLEVNVHEIVEMIKND